MSGTLYEVFSRVMQVLVGKKITVLDVISCSNRATNGFLYPLDKGFIFVHEPTIYIKFYTLWTKGSSLSTSPPSTSSSIPSGQRVHLCPRAHHLHQVLYPLDKGLIFVHEPTIYIKFEGIASVNFGRMSGGAGVSRYIL